MQTNGKLNWLQHNLPDGLAVDSLWLESHGYSRSLRNHYLTKGWLEPLARGVYRRPSAPLPGRGKVQDLLWEQVVVSLQTLMSKPIAIGGRTALELQGFSHYLAPSGPREVHLYANEEPPSWVFRVRLNARLVFHNATKLFRPALRSRAAGNQTARPTDTIAPDVADSHAGLMRQTWGHWSWPLLMSTPERAILELLEQVPQKETFHQADVLMEGLRNLSPKRLQHLLADCRSIKVKRLFLWFAERHNHAWLKKLDRTAIDLGRGKRMLVRGGKLDTKFNITVPENLDARG
jgi:hypothetical protein